MSARPVVGFDFGTVNCVISQAKRGGIDTVLNEASQRKTAAAISFQGSQRFLGAAAVPLSKSNYKNTVKCVKRLMGRKFDDPSVQREISLLPNPKAFIKLPDGAVGFKCNYNDTETTFSCEQLAAVLINKLRNTVSKEIPPSDVVISLPGFWNSAQRKSLLDACKIAGFTPLRLLNSHTAAALSYGIYKSARNVFDAEKKQIVMFIDVGYSATSVAVVSFIQGKLNVISTGYDSELGGRDFDSAIFEKFREEFKAKHNLDVNDNPKAVIKLREAAEKAKHTLTPEGVTVANVHVEFLMNEIDFRTKLELSDFEAMSETLLNRLKKPIEDAITGANLTRQEIESVEIIGGATRPKIVKKALAESMELDLTKPNYGLSTTLNLDEAVAKGCALNSAMLSPVFKVKEFNVYDCVDSPLTLTWDQNGAVATSNGSSAEPAVNSVTILQKGMQTPCTKRITFHRTEDFEIKATKEEADLANFKVIVDKSKAPVVDENSTEGEPKAPMIRVDFRQDLNGLFSLVGAESLHELPAEVEKAPEKEPTEEKKSDDDKEKEKESKSESKDEEKMETEEKEKTEKVEEKPKEPEKKKKRFKKVKLQVQTTYAYGLPKETLESYTALERTYAANDLKIEQTAFVRNELETYIYSYRDKVDIGLKEFLTDAERSTFSGNLTSEENWLYDEGFDESKEEYQKRLDSLKASGDRFDVRLFEWEARPKATAALHAVIRNFREVVNSVDEEKYGHIEESEREKVREKIKEIEQWLEEQTKGQETVGKSGDPVLTSAMILEQQRKLETVGYPVVNKPKPKPPTPPPAAEPEKKEEEAAAEPTEDAEKNTEMENEPAEKEQEGMEVD